MALKAGKSARSTRWTRHDTTSSSDAPAASRTVWMLWKVCSVCSSRSSLTTLPVFGSNPPWPDRKIHSPTVSPAEYGPAGTGTIGELIRAFIVRRLLECSLGCPPPYIYRSVYVVLAHDSLEVDDAQARFRSASDIVRERLTLARCRLSVPIGLYTSAH